MGSPITFSGFNDIDFNVVLNSIMAQASQPLTALQSRQTALRSQTTSIDQLASRVRALDTAADALSRIQDLSTLSGRSSDSFSLGVSTDTTALAGHLDVIVNEIARAQVTASTSTSPDSTSTIIATGGALTVGGVTVSVTGPVTLKQLAQQINATDGIGVTAQVLKTGANAYRLALTSTETGLANAFTISNGLTGGAGITFADTDNNNISGDSPEDNSVNASDASILINNIVATSTTNTFADVVEGVTLTTLRADTETTIGVDVGPDGSALKSKVESFITAYNALVSFVNDQRASAAKGEAGSLGRDPLLRSLHGSLRAALLAAHGSQTLQRLPEVGVELTSAGTLELNTTKFNEVIASDGEGVRQLFGATDGAFQAVTSLLGTYVDADGLFSSSKTQLQRQISSMDTQILNMQARLALQRAALQKEFTEADAAMARLRQQSSSLSTFGNSQGSF